MNFRTQEPCCSLECFTRNKKVPATSGWKTPQEKKRHKLYNVYPNVAIKQTVSTSELFFLSKRYLHCISRKSKDLEKERRVSESKFFSFLVQFLHQNEPLEFDFCCNKTKTHSKDEHNPVLWFLGSNRWCLSWFSYHVSPVSAVLQ